MSDIPEWAMEEANKTLFGLHTVWERRQIIARALVKAKDQGIAEERERISSAARCLFPGGEYSVTRGAIIAAIETSTKFPS